MADTASVFLPAGLALENVTSAIAMMLGKGRVVSVGESPYPVIWTTEDWRVTAMEGDSGYLVGTLGDFKFINIPHTWFDGKPGQRFVFGSDDADYQVAVELVMLFGGYAFYGNALRANTSCVAHMEPVYFLDTTDNEKFLAMRNALAEIQPIKVVATKAEEPSWLSFEQIDQQYSN